MGDKTAVPALIKALKDKDFRVCGYAARALGEIGDRSAVPALISALGDKKDQVRTKAANALKEITGQSFGKDISKWNAWWKKNKGK